MRIMTADAVRQSSLGVISSAALPLWMTSARRDRQTRSECRERLRRHSRAGVSTGAGAAGSRPTHNRHVELDDGPSRPGLRRACLAAGPHPRQALTGAAEQGERSEVGMSGRQTETSSVAARARPGQGRASPASA